MDAIREHLQAHYIYYVVAALVVLPPFLYFRRRTFPIVLYAVEFSVYAAIMHVAVFVLTVSLAWFRENTQMRVVKDRVALGLDWHTPILRFWERELYKPQWLFTLEVVALVIILLGMWKFRPMAVQKPKKKVPPKKPGMSSTQFGDKTQFGGKK